MIRLYHDISWYIFRKLTKQAIKNTQELPLLCGYWVAKSMWHDMQKRFYTNMMLNVITRSICTTTLVRFHVQRIKDHYRYNFERMTIFFLKKYELGVGNYMKVWGWIFWKYGTHSWKKEKKFKFPLHIYKNIGQSLLISKLVYDHLVWFSVLKKNSTYLLLN